MDTLNKFRFSPISDLCKTRLFLEDEKLQWVTPTSLIYKNVLDTFERKFCLLNFEELRENVESRIPHLALDGTASEHYSREVSVKILNRFLLAQFDNSESKLTEFMHTLYKWLTKQNGKFNCIYIIGEPSSGKSFFARLVMGICLSVGIIGNMNKFNQFPLNNCINKRLLYWDEPNFEGKATEDLKLLFSGNELSVAQKYLGNGTIQKTPCLLTSNDNVMPENDAFNCRIKRYYWRKPHILSLLKRSLDPICLFDLFDKYVPNKSIGNLEEDESEIKAMLDSLEMAEEL